MASLRPRRRAELPTGGMRCAELPTGGAYCSHPPAEGASEGQLRHVTPAGRGPSRVVGVEFAAGRAGRAAAACV